VRVRGGGRSGASGEEGGVARRHPGCGGIQGEGEGGYHPPREEGDRYPR
jgi:hypothetical protein